METTDGTTAFVSEWLTDEAVNLSSLEQLEEVTEKVHTARVGDISIPFLVQFLVGISILVANFVILAVLHRTRVVARTLNRLLQSLAVADLGMAVASIYRAGLMAAYGTAVEERPMRCGPVVVLYLLSSGGSVCSLLLIAIDQWRTARQSTMLEERQRWRRQSRWGIGISWAIWVVLSMLGLAATKREGEFKMSDSPCLMTGTYVYNSYWQVVGLSLLFTCILTVVFQILSLRAVRANILNLMEAVEQRHQGFMISASSTSFSVCAPTSCSHPAGGVFPLHPPKKKYQVPWGQGKVAPVGGGHLGAKERKHTTSSVSNVHTIITKGDSFEMNLARTRLRLTKTITFVMVVFMVCWFSYLPAVLILSACGESCRRVHAQVGYLGTLVVANSLMNAFIYIIRIKQFRRELKRLCSMKASSSTLVQPLTDAATIGELGLPPVH